MSKMLNRFSVQSNGEDIIIAVHESEKGIRVEILGTSMDVFINGEEFYSKYDKEEYKYIPSNLRGFISKYFCDYSELKKEDGCVTCDISLEGKDYFVKISTKRAKDNSIIFVNDLENYELVNEYKDVRIPNAKENFEKLIKQVKEIGYSLGYSHSGNETYDWYQLIVPIDKFDEKKVLECVKLWQSYNETFDKYIK